ncbi:MAG: hypothetical protein A3H97_06480 [Acidobacteria bacterium RIFCSPLOWO2_02_FULL_65_29]|nr:MAG: hypothetical protein A3H97_06480 [Acidobacteria bacterium RIFCSPLOWO2_02_FULL_65_29]
MTGPYGKSTLTNVPTDHEERLASVHLDIPFNVTDRKALAVLARRISDALSEPVGLYVPHGREWQLDAVSAAESSVPPIDHLGAALASVASAPAQPAVEQWADADDTWTLVCCRTRPVIVVAMRGAWATLSPALLLLARNVELMWRARRAMARARSRLASHRLARRLSQVTGLQPVHEAIVETMASAVNARVAALAIPDAADRGLSIVATRGYALELVEHLRIPPSAGVFGAVFQSGRAIHVRDKGALPEARRPRPRYRTDSFIGIPIRAASDVLGVVCVTDRLDEEAFTIEDVWTLKALAVPAALALGRERALVQAENYALTAAIDPLSGAFNRRHFHIRLEEELQRARRHRLSLAFVMIDIDDFKQVNDSYGHLAGDTVIKDVAEILRRSVRVFDLCARFGGEEFAIIMPGSVLEGAAAVAERIRERIEAYRSSEGPLETLRLTASLGLAVSSPGVAGRDLIARADHALYLAKRAGKNCVRTAEIAPMAESAAQGAAGPDVAAGEPEQTDS